MLVANKSQISHLPSAINWAARVSHLTSSLFSDQGQSVALQIHHTLLSLHVTRFAGNSLIYRGLLTSLRASRFHFPVTLLPLCFHSGPRPARGTAVRECGTAIYGRESAVYEHELAVYEHESAVLVAKRSAFRPKR